MAIRANISIEIGGNAVAYLRDASLSIEQDFVPVAAEHVYGWPDALPGARSWSAQGSYLVPIAGSDAAVAAIKAAMEGRTTVACTIVMQDTTETSTAVVSGFTVQASIGGALEGSFSLTGTAPL